MPSAARAAPDGTDGKPDSECTVELRITELTNGSRLFLKALTFGPPRASNKSVSVGSLYALPQGLLTHWRPWAY